LFSDNTISGQVFEVPVVALAPAKRVSAAKFSAQSVSATARAPTSTVILLRFLSAR
jgi:hypothetical protein